MDKDSKGQRKWEDSARGQLPAWNRTEQNRSPSLPALETDALPLNHIAVVWQLWYIQLGRRGGGERERERERGGGGGRGGGRGSLRHRRERKRGRGHFRVW